MQNDETDDQDFSKTIKMYDKLESKFSYPLDMKKNGQKFRLYT